MKLLNSLTSRIEPVVPMDPKLLRLYVCGPTTYDDLHLGNIRTAVVFDTLARVLRREFPVQYVTNFTDIDDKIINRADAEGVSVSELTERVIKSIREDWAGLNVSPTITPKATESLDGIFDMIHTLLGSGHAYKGENQDILFRLSSFSNHGQLSNQKDKADSKDFALWKSRPETEVGYDSEFGYGRPGWHIECSAMIRQHMGQTIDIHGGGMDLKFPHHENEIAQSVCAHGVPLATMFVHSGMVTVSGTKMAKSLGNQILYKGLLDRYDPKVIRFDLLRTKYNQIYDFTYNRLDESKRIYEKLTSILLSSPLERKRGAVGPVPDEVLELLQNDFNTPVAIMKLQQLWKAKDYFGVEAGLHLLGVGA